MAVMATPVRSLAFPARVSTRLRARVSAPRFAPADWTTGRSSSPGHAGSGRRRRSRDVDRERPASARARFRARRGGFRPTSPPPPARRSAGSRTSSSPPLPPPRSRCSPRASRASSSRFARWSAPVARPPSPVAPCLSARRASTPPAPPSRPPSSRRTRCWTTSTTSAPPPHPSSRRRQGGGRAPTKALRPSNTASRTLMEAITQQYSAPSRSHHGRTHGRVGRRRAHRDRQRHRGRARGRALVERSAGVQLHLQSRQQVPRRGIPPVPRTNNTYTWGVVELNDLDYSVDESGDEEGDERCAACGRRGIPTTSGHVRRREQGHRRSERERVGGEARMVRARARGAGGVGAVGQGGGIRAADHGAHSRGGGEYKVVVELDTSVYSFKIMNAGSGKRVK